MDLATTELRELEVLISGDEIIKLIEDWAASHFGKNCFFDWRDDVPSLRITLTKRTDFRDVTLDPHRADLITDFLAASSLGKKSS